MKTPKVIRPEIEVEYKSFFGFLYALYVICHVGIKRAKISCMVGKLDVKDIHFWIIPKYKFIRESDSN